MQPQEMVTQVPRVHEKDADRPVRRLHEQTDGTVCSVLHAGRLHQHAVWRSRADSRIGGINMIDRRTFSTALIGGVATSLFGRPGKAQAQPAVSARNVVLVHGAYADGSCWSEVIGRLQLVGL